MSCPLLAAQQNENGTPSVHPPVNEDGVVWLLSGDPEVVIQVCDVQLDTGAALATHTLRKQVQG